MEVQCQVVHQHGPFHKRRLGDGQCLKVNENGLVFGSGAWGNGMKDCGIWATLTEHQLMVYTYVHSLSLRVSGCSAGE